MTGHLSIRPHSTVTITQRVGSSLTIVFFVLAGAALIFTGGAIASFQFALDLLASSPTMTDRMVRDGVQSTCAAVKGYPGDFGTTAAYRYRTSTITYNGISGCHTFKVVQGGTCAHISLYSPTFNPANRAMNYLGDTGNPGNGREMSVSLLQGVTITAVATDIVGNATADCFVRVLALITPAAHDFDSIGTSDIAWRQNGTGVVAVWLMTGGTVAQSAALGSVPNNWSIVGQRDFNGDGKDDLLWRDTTSGTVAIWFLDGPTVKSTAAVGSVPNNWSIVGCHDFNGDGKADLLWRDTSGNVAIWLMDGAQVVRTTLLGQVPTDWSVAAVADFNGDGQGDILWRNTSTGEVAIWFIIGALPIAPTLLATVPLTWSIVATGDFSQDAIADIVWRDTSGNIVIWTMDYVLGPRVVSSNLLGTVPVNWTLVETGDFKAKGVADLLWRDTTTGAVAIWFMDGPAVGSTAVLGTVPTDWVIQNVNVN
jgi:FG-GAP-like repeat